MKKHFTILALMSIAVIYNCNAQSKNDSLATFIQNKVTQIHAKEKIPGIFVGVLNNGQKSFYNAGFAIPDSNTPFDSSTIFEIGSITKTFTAYVLMSVLNKKNIPETESIVKYLPDSVQQNSHLAAISFLSLMNHTAGFPKLPKNIYPANPMQPYEDYTISKLNAYLKTCVPNPDGKYSYSNFGAGLAGVLASSISGKTYHQLVADFISDYFKNNDGKENKSQGYFSDTIKAAFWNMNVLAPAGELKYSANDMLAYLQNMCFPPSKNAKEIVDKLTTQTASINAQLGIGLGWHILGYNDPTPVFWHNGGTYGFSTFCAFAKNKSKAIIVVINQSDKNGACDLLGATIFKKLLSAE